MPRKPNDKKMNDIDALKTLIDILGKVERNDRERILRWTCEKLDIQLPLPATYIPPVSPAAPQSEIVRQPKYGSGREGKDIRSFISQKKPSSANQIAAVTAYYHQFEAPANQRKKSITAEDLKHACKVIGRKKLSNPSITLSNARHTGWLDMAGTRGAYKISTFGENMVAVLPGGKGQPKPPTRRKKKKKASKKKTSKKAAK